MASINEKTVPYGEKGVNEAVAYRQSSDNIGITVEVGQLKRHLSNRQVQLIAIGGSIGTALFVTIGVGLIQGGPASLLLGFITYGIFLGLVNNCMAEMATYMPVSGGWIRMGSHWVDDAFGFMSGWNFFLYEALLIPWEIAALNLILGFWSDKIPVAAICVGCIVLYGLINVFAIRYYGEAEFWLAIGKVILILLVFGFTFVTMVGGNPDHDAYGFRHWKNPGAFAEHITTGSLGRFEGYLACIWRGAFIIVGPEYLSMIAGEAANPRKTMKNAFKALYWRFAIFFLGGALCCGIVIPYNDKTLYDRLYLGSSSGTGASSPFVIAMENMGVKVLPHIANALLCTSIFSAGNTYVYCSTRTLYALALDGHAPKFLRRVTKNGVPIYCFGVVMVFPFLSFLQLGSSAATVIDWLANLITAAQILDYIFMAIVYLFFYRAMKAQGISRDTLPYKGWFQPYSAWIGLGGMIFVVTCYGYATFLPGAWDVGTFFIYYTMIFASIVFFVGWKLFKKTKFIKPLEADLIWEKTEIDAYEAAFTEKDVGFWQECLQMLGIKKKTVESVE